MYTKRIIKAVILFALSFIVLQSCLEVFSIFSKSDIIQNDQLKKENTVLYDAVKDILENQNTMYVSVNYNEIVDSAGDSQSMLEKEIQKMVDHSANFINIGNSGGNISVESVYDIEGLTEDKEEYIKCFRKEQYDGWVDLTETLNLVRMNIRGKYWDDLTDEEKIKIVQNMCIWDNNARLKIIKFETDRILKMYPNFS